MCKCVFCLFVSSMCVRSMESGCLVWAPGTNLTWKKTWWRSTPPGLNSHLHPTVESWPSTGPTVCKKHCKSSLKCYINASSIIAARLQECIYGADADHYFFIFSPLCRNDDKCLQGIANGTISGMTTHTTCRYLEIFSVFSVSLGCVMLHWRCTTWRTVYIS